MCVYAGVYAHVVCESASQRTRLDVMSLTAIPLFSSVSPWIGTYHSRLGGLVSPGICGFVLPPQLTSSLAYLLTWRLVEEGSSVSLTSLFPFPIFVFPHFPFPLLLVPFSSISLRPPRTSLPPPPPFFLTSLLTQLGTLLSKHPNQVRLPVPQSCAKGR